MICVFSEPQATVQNLHGKQNGRNIELSWKEVALDQQKGFILGYKVETTHLESKKVINTIETKGGFILYLTSTVFV